MPFIPNTPESYLSRNDSLPSETTCRGITSNGKPCRRPLAASNAGSPASKHSKKKNNAVTEGMYCWQHKEQAAHHSASPSPGKSGGSVAEGGKRTSIDTLADRLGLMGVDSEVGGKQKRRKSKKKTSGARTLLCCFCFSIPIEEVPRPSRPQPRPVQKVQQVASVPPTTPTKTRPGVDSATASPPARISYGPNSSPLNGKGKSSGKNQAGNYLSYIPPSTDPQTASLLMAELAKPFVESEEPGYIYMFWMTPASAKKPAPVDAARQFLAPPTTGASSSGSPRSRRASDAVSSYYKNPAGNGGGKATMLLKIGRAANVQRRMNQWSRQCDYDVEVLRFYPYIPSSERGAAAAADNRRTLRPEAGGPRMTPHVRKVERLVHLELQGMGLRAELGTCAACGKEHREWFKVGASRGEVRVVDEVIRRWVQWDEGTV